MNIEQQAAMAAFTSDMNDLARRYGAHLETGDRQGLTVVDTETGGGLIALEWDPEQKEYV